MATGRDLDDVIEWSKFCQAAWRADGSGFYYCSMQPTAAGAEYLESNTPGRIFLHRLGKPQADDELVFSAPDEPDWMPYAEVSDDGRFLVITVAKGSVFENQLLVLDLHDPDGTWRPLVGDFESSNQVVTNAGTTFYLVTDYGAERKRLVAVDLDQPGREHWREVIGEATDTLVNVSFFGGHFVCHYLKDAHSVLRVHAIDGGHVRDIPLPGIASLGLDPQLNWALTGRAQSDLMHFATTTFTDPGSIWSHRLSTGQTEIIERAAAAIDPGSYVTEQVFAESADGTRVPMFLTRHRDLAADGQAPALLYAYGGFDVSITPSFSPELAVWLERGGVLAVANLRGGGEYGKAWHEAGRRAAKQNVFDDFCACARWLASSGWSSRDRIAIMGGSNGGLLVGACLTQHPELFGAVVGHVGVYDMLRFHKFTIGWAWTGEIGSPDDPAGVPVAARVLAPAQRAARHALPGNAPAHRRSRRPGRARPLVQVRGRHAGGAGRRGADPDPRRHGGRPRGRQANRQADRGRHRRADVPGRGAPGDLIALFAGRPVDPLPQQVGMPQVPRVLLDQVQAEPAQGVRLPRPERVVEPVTRHDLPRPGAVRAERLQVRGRPRRGHRPEITFLVLIRAVQEPDPPVGQLVPVHPLHLRHVPYQPSQRHRRRLTRPRCQLLPAQPSHLASRLAR